MGMNTEADELERISMKNAVVGIVGASLLATVFLLIWFSPAYQKTNQAQAIQPNRGQSTSTSEQNKLIPSTISDEPQGQGLEVNAKGGLTVSPNTRQVFDYFLGTQSTPSAANIARTQNYIHTHLNEQAALQANVILKDYAAYRKAADESRIHHAEIYSFGDKDLNSIVQMQQLTTLKATYMSSETIHDLYGDEDAIASYMLAKKQVMKMNGLSQEQKDDQLATLFKKLPISAQKTIENSASGTP